MAANVPKIIASTVAAGATMMLFFKARIHSAEAKKSWYQCNENPCNGYTKKLPELNDSGMITNTGRIRNNRIRPQRIRKL